MSWFDRFEAFMIRLPDSVLIILIVLFFGLAVTSFAVYLHAVILAVLRV